MAIDKINFDGTEIPIPSRTSQLINDTNYVQGTPEGRVAVEDAVEGNEAVNLRQVSQLIGQNSGNQNDWITVYDMASDDASINWGYTAGLQSSIGAVSNSVDFTNYHFVRVYWNKGSYDSYHDFDISSIKEITSYIPYFTTAHFDSGINVLSGIAIGFKYDETTGQRGFYVGRGRSWNLKANAYNTSTDLSTDTAVYVYKIQVK